MTMLNNTSPYAVTAPGVRRGAAILLAGLGRLINQWIAAVIARIASVRQSWPPCAISATGTSKTSASTAMRSATLWRRGPRSERECNIPNDPDASQTLAKPVQREANGGNAERSGRRDRG